MAPPNPLLQYDSPRRAYNSTEYTETQSSVTLTSQGVALTSNLLLGSGIVIEQVPASPGQSQVLYTKLSVSADIASLVARVEALEAMFAGSGTITVDRIIVHTIEAKRLGEAPDINVPDIRIIVREYPTNTEQEVWMAVGGNSADMELGGRQCWFDGTSQKKQTLPFGYVLGDVVGRFENYNLLEELPP